MAKKTDSTSKPTVPEKPPVKAAPEKPPVKAAAEKPPVKAPAKKKPAAKSVKTAAAKKAKPAAKKAVKPAASAYTREDVALRAYFISEKRHAQGLHGNEHLDWLEAERQLAAEHGKPKKAKKV